MNINISRKSFKAYMDLTRLHFGIVWPLLFCSGLIVAFNNYGGFSWLLLIKVALIGFFGFEAGMVLNDYVDRELDKKDIENGLTEYWRPFNTRPIAMGLISPTKALVIIISFILITVGLIATLPYPNSLYIFGIMIYAYGMEVFYQLKKRKQHLPIAQLLGRTDFTLFPIAGYLCYGTIDLTVILYFLFFYPLAMAHLGINDLADVENDKKRGLYTITTMYGEQGNSYWIFGFTMIHILMATIFVSQLGIVSLIGFCIGYSLLILVNYLILKEKTPTSALKALPIFHASLFVYLISIFLVLVV